MKISSIDVSKIDENRCKQTLAIRPCFWGIQMSLPQNTALHVVVNMSSLPIYTKEI